MKVGDIIKSKYTILGHNAHIGIVIKLREGAYEGQPLAQVFWPHRRDTGWAEAKDMEVVSESR
jgi:hypothetical protein|tara:strand:- start:1300 stop:1488 length:189 start_codon:yes stop_codon:yes gene_type:complete